MPVEEQVVSIFLGTGGHLDSVPVDDVTRFEALIPGPRAGIEESILKQIRESGEFSEEISDKLTEAVDEFKKRVFAACNGAPSVVPDERDRSARRRGPVGQGIGAGTQARTEGRKRSNRRGGCHTSPAAWAGPLGRIDQRDHQGPGNDRNLSYRQSAVHPPLAEARPFANEITRMLTTLGNEAALDHPLLVERPDPKRAGVLVVSSDRGLCGAYNSSIFRRRQKTLLPAAEGRRKQQFLYTIARKASSHYSFRNWDIAGSSTGVADATQVQERCRRSPRLWSTAFLAGAGDEDKKESDSTAEPSTNCTSSTPSPSR